jgi:hypothetical protein
MAEFDIFKPQVSVVARGLEGKTVLVYGSASTGKTRQATRAKKPFYIGFEAGINAISGIPFLPMNGKWSNFKKINRQLTNPKTLDQAKESYNTIILDTVEASAQYCQDYICEKEGVETIGEIPHGAGYKMYEVEYWREINRLTSAGYTVYFISHEGQREFLDEKGESYSKIYPKGDKRSIDPICDLCDIIVYARPNGLDPSGKEIKSSAFMVNTSEYLARSRFDYMTPYLKEFTIENLEDAIAKAIEEEEKTNGKKAVVSFEEKKTTEKVEEKTFEKIVEEIKKYATWLHAQDKFKDYSAIVKSYLGEGSSVSEAQPSQKQQLEMILFDLEEEYSEAIDS